MVDFDEKGCGYDLTLRPAASALRFNGLRRLYLAVFSGFGIFIALEPHAKEWFSEWQSKTCQSELYNRNVSIFECSSGGAICYHARISLFCNNLSLRVLYSDEFSVP